MRWHLFYDGEHVISVVAQGTGTTLCWSQGPAMEAAEFGKSDILQARVKELSHSLKLSMRTQASLGVVHELERAKTMSELTRLLH